MSVCLSGGDGITRIVHYIGSLNFGGSQSFVMGLYRNIDRSIIQFDFVTYPNEKGGFYKEIIDLGGHVYECPRYNGKNHFQFIKWWKNFFELHPEYKVLHGHVRSVASIYIPIAKQYGLTAIAHSHSASNGRGFLGAIKNILQLPVRNMADYLFACSEKAGQWMYGKNCIYRENYKLIPNAIEAGNYLFDEKKRDKIRNELDLNGKYVVGHVGRMVEPKNHAFLLDVFREVYIRDNDCRLLLIGDGELRFKIEEKARILGIFDAIIFIGSSSTPAPYYNAMDIFVFPSLWEGLGIVAIEAQTNGLFCVISDRVPADADMKLSLVKQVELEKGASYWAEVILRRKYENHKKIYRQDVIQAGYDIVETAKNIEYFYLHLIKKDT